MLTMSVVDNSQPQALAGGWACVVLPALVLVAGIPATNAGDPRWAAIAIREVEMSRAAELLVTLPTYTSQKGKSLT
jgi:hypothetical protein